MKIAVVGPAHVSHVQMWAVWLAGRGHDVRVFTDAPTDLDYGAVPVEVCSWSALQKLWTFKVRRGDFPTERDRWRVFRKPIAAFHPDVLHVHEAFRTGPILQHFPQFASVLTPWGTDVESLVLAEGERRSLILRALAFADVIATNAVGLEEHWGRLSGIPEKRFDLFSWGVDTSMFHPRGTEELEGVRRLLGVGSEAFLLSPRRADAVRGVDRILAAWRRVRQEGAVSDKRLVVLRAGATDAEFAWLRNEFGGDESIILHDGFLSSDQLAAAYSAARGVIHAPPKDLLANSVVEAMACGAPQIVTPNRCYEAALRPPDISDETRAPALFAASHMEEDLAEAIAQWASASDSDLGAMGTESVDVASRRFRAEDCRPHMEQALEHACERAARRLGRAQ